METVQLDHDITIMYTTAISFPDGIMAAHDKLHATVPSSVARRFFGVSRPENGKIVYKAAAEELHAGEAKEFHLNTMTLKKGTYISATVSSYQKDLPAIALTFEKLLAHPGIDPQGYCVEWYFNDADVRCMVRLAG